VRKYAAPGWARAGQTVRRARERHGYSDTKEWADAVGRSSRQLLGFERGEPVGDQTIGRIESVLDWPSEVIEHLARGKPPEWWPRDFEEWREVCIATVDYQGMKENVTRPVDPDAPLLRVEAQDSALAEVSNEALLAEVLRRLEDPPGATISRIRRSPDVEPSAQGKAARKVTEPMRRDQVQHLDDD
jgi:hypothetical protein